MANGRRQMLLKRLRLEATDADTSIQALRFENEGFRGLAYSTAISVLVGKQRLNQLFPKLMSEKKMKDSMRVINRK